MENYVRFCADYLLPERLQSMKLQKIIWAKNNPLKVQLERAFDAEELKGV